MDINKIKCSCGQEFKASDFSNHFRICQQFKEEFKELDSKVGNLLKAYSKPMEKLLIVRYLLILYVRVIERKIEKNVMSKTYDKKPMFSKGIYILENNNINKEIEQYIIENDIKLVEEINKLNIEKNIVKNSLNKLYNDNNNLKIELDKAINNNEVSKLKNDIKLKEEINKLNIEKDTLKKSINKLYNDNNNLKNELDKAINNNEINKLKNDIKKLKEEINKLNIEKDTLKKSINKLYNDNNNLENELDKDKIIILNLKNNDNNEINKLKNDIKLKEEINNLKIKLQNDNNEGYFKFDDIIVIKFISIDQIINNYPIKCLKTNTFAEIEEKLYKIFNEFRNTNNSLICNGASILRFKKINDYNIKDGDTIQLIKNE